MAENISANIKHLFDVELKDVPRAYGYTLRRVLRCTTHDITITDRGFLSREEVWIFTVHMMANDLDMYIELKPDQDDGEAAFITNSRLAPTFDITILNDSTIRSILELAFRELIVEPIPKFVWDLR